MIQIWQKVKEKGKSLPFIFPIVIYHGKQTWTSDTNFASLVHIPQEMNEYVPHFSYFLYDLSKFSDDEIKGTILSRVALLLFKHIYDEDFGEQFIRICKLLGELGEEKTALQFMRSILEYKGFQQGFHLALEIKYGSAGLDFYERMKDKATLETLRCIEQAIRKNATIDELGNIMKQ